MHYTVSISLLDFGFIGKVLLMNAEVCTLWDMAKTTREPLTTRRFAEAMKVNYRTALNWLRAGLVPGAEEKEIPLNPGRTYWEIPESALTMERPKPGPKPKPAEEDQPAADEEKPAGKSVKSKKPTKKEGKKSAKKAGGAVGNG